MQITITDITNRDKKIQAIKELREATRVMHRDSSGELYEHSVMGLRETKVIIDAVYAGMPQRVEVARLPDPDVLVYTRTAADTAEHHTTAIQTLTLILQVGTVDQALRAAQALGRADIIELIGELSA